MSQNETQARADSKREELRRKVEASRADLAAPQDKGANPPDDMRQLAMDYPFALVLGGLALGVLAGALIPRSAARKLVRGAAAAATVAGELGLAYGRSAVDKSGEAVSAAAGGAAERIDSLGETVRELAGTLARSAAQIATDAMDRATDATRQVGAAASEASASARETGTRIGQQAIRLRSHLRH